MKATKIGINILIASLLIFSLIGCSNEADVLNGTVEEYNSLLGAIDNTMEGLNIEGGQSPILDELKNANDEDKVILAMSLADDMAFATAFGLVTDEFLAISSEALKAYPHPLILNNYATMLYSKDNLEDALFYYTLALNQEPDNPILLTNIANLYLEQENFEAARDFATQALRSMNDFGPAYQVLTTIHLKDENHILAAETMIKSSKYNFDDTTMYHYESFLQAVHMLDPAEDDYPLQADMIDELYRIAHTNVDTKDVNADVDTPDAQITVQPFPQVGSAEHLIKMQSYLIAETRKIYDLRDDAKYRQSRYEERFSDYLRVEQEELESIPILKNLRQFYAYEILESYYTFHLEKAISMYRNKKESETDVLYEKLDRVDRIYDEKLEQNSQAITELRAKVNMWTSFDELEKINQELQELSVKAFEIAYERFKERYAAEKHHVEWLIGEMNYTYDEIAVLLEEFWLRSGGLVKYMVHEDMFEYVNARREALVYNYAATMIDELYGRATMIDGVKLDRDSRQQEYLAYLALLQSPMQQEVEEEEEPEIEISEDDLIPLIESNAISTYPESYDIGDMYLETGVFGYNVALSFNGETFELSYDTPYDGAGGIQWSPYTYDQYKSYTIHGVRMEGNTDWFTDFETVKKALDKTGKLGKVVGKLGGIGIGFSNHVRTGEYTVKKIGGPVLDRGTMYVREEGGSIGDFSKSTRIEVTRSTMETESQMTRVAEKRTTVKYKYDFIGISRPK